MTLRFHEGQTVRVRGTRSIVSRVITSTVDPDLARLDLRIVTGQPAGGAFSVFVPIDDVVSEDPPPLRLEAMTSYRLWERFHDAHRFELALPPDSLSATPQARIAIEQYQRVPAQRALALARPRLLIADDVGLGKTIEAGLVYLELATRRRARRVLIVAPASICTQWQRELSEKFGIEFDHFTRDEIERVRRASDIGSNPFMLRPRVIISLDLAKMDATFAELRKSRWDLAIIDEAHHVALDDDDDKTLNRRFAEWLATAAHGLLLLSATPHDGNDATFTSLLALLEPRIVPPGAPLQRAAIDPHIVRRLKRDIRNADGSPRFVPREQVLGLPVPLSRAESELHELVTQTILALKDVAKKSRAGERVRVEFLTTIVRKRLASSRTALARTIANRRATVDRTLDALGAHRDLLRRARAGEPLTDQEQEQLELDLHATSLPSAQRRVGVRRTQSEDERDAFDALEAKIAEMSAEPESKVAVLTRHLDAAWAEEPSENVLVFTEYRDTAESLAAALRERYEGRVMLAHGDSEDRAGTLARFGTESGLVLVATDVASEGLNLQDRCRTVVHYDLPWNPNRLEQRNGRVDRYGQRRAPRIAYLYADGTYDGELLKILVGKVERQIASLGSVGDVLGSLQPRQIDRIFERTEVSMTPDLRRDAESRIDGVLSSAQAPRALSSIETRTGPPRLTSRPELGSFLEGAIRQCGGDAAVTGNVLTVRVFPAAWSVDRTQARFALPGGPGDVPLLTELSPLFRAAINALRELRYDARHDPRVAAVVHADATVPTLVATFLISIRSEGGDVVERLAAIATAQGGSPYSAEALLRPTDSGLAEPQDLGARARATFGSWWEAELPKVAVAARAEAEVWQKKLAQERADQQRRALQQLADWYAAECRVAREQDGAVTFTFGAEDSPAVKRKIARIEHDYTIQKRSLEAGANLLPASCESLGLLLVMPRNGKEQ